MPSYAQNFCAAVAAYMREVLRVAQIWERPGGERTCRERMERVDLTKMTPERS
jgi:hypothetical protein